MSVKIIDKSSKFAEKVEEQCELALQKMGMDIEILAKTQKAPTKGGRLAATIVHEKVDRLHWRVPADTVYARYQEFGGDGARKVRKYTKPGTGAHYLRDSGDIVKRNVVAYLKEKLSNILL